MGRIENMPPTDPAKLAEAAAALQKNLPKLDPKSGQHAMAKAEGDSKNTRQETTVKFADPETIQELVGNIEDIPAIQDQREGLNRLESLIGAQAAAPSAGGMPYAYAKGLGALSDAWYGTKLSAGVPDQSPDAAKNKQLMDYIQKVQTDKRDLSGKVLEAAKAFKAGQINDLFQQMMKTSITGETGQLKGGGKPYDPTMDVGRLQKALEPLTGFGTSYKYLDSLIAKVIPGGIDAWKKGKEIPGIGPGKELLFRTYPKAMSPEGREIVQAYMNLQDDLLRAKSGAQINESEFRRLKSTLGSGITAGPEEFVNAMKRFRSTLADVMKQREARIKGVRPEVVDYYKKGGGETSDQFKSKVTHEVPKDDTEAKKKAIEERMKKIEAILGKE
jgi:hypothetical protein